VEDDRIVEALKAGQTSDPELFSAAEREMFAFLETLTLDPSAVREEDVEALRSAGFDDPEILEIVTVAGYFSLMNRMSDGLGVELEDWYQQAEQ
jgi:alkylhydroperoxidase family enzyme